MNTDNADHRIATADMSTPSPLHPPAAQRTRHPGVQHVATFPIAHRADAFAARIAEDGWRVVDIEHKPGSRTVRFTDSDHDWSSSPEGGYAGWRDMLDTVGYFGSDGRRKAKLDGASAPMSY